MFAFKKHPHNRGIEMNNGPILKNLLRFSVPMMFIGVLQLLFSAADIAVAGQYLGEAEQAAIGTTATLITLLVNLFVGLSVGVSVVLGRAYGSREVLPIRRTVHTAMLLSVIWGAMVALISIVAAEQLLGLMQVPEQILPMAARYLRIYACGMLGSSLFNFGGAVLRATGDSRHPLYSLAVSCVLNFGLNLLFVRVWNMGLEGIALSTAISLWVMGLMTVLFMTHAEGAAKFSFRHLRLHSGTLKKILGMGIPAGLQGIFFPLSNIVLQSYINGFGATVIAANGAACNIESFVYQALNGFYHGCMTFVTSNAGAGNWKRIRAVFRQSLAAVTVTGLVLGLAMVAFGKPLLGIYNPDGPVIEAGQLRFLFTGIPYFLCGIMEVIVGAARGLGSSMRPMLISVLGVCGIRILWVLTVFRLPQFNNVETIYFSYPLSWAVTCVAQGVWLALLIKKMRKRYGVPLYLLALKKESRV